MDVREKLVELLCEAQHIVTNTNKAEYLAEHGVTVQKCGEWVHPKGYVVSNGFLCSNCGHEEASHYPINQNLAVFA